MKTTEAPAMTRGEDNIKWIGDNLRIPEGPGVGQPLELPEFMREDILAIYDNPAGTRRAIISRGRKNAKTTECAAILLLHLCGLEAKVNSQLFSAAQSRDQAAVLFGLASKMVRLNRDLSKFVRIRDTAKELICPELGTTYRALSADSSTALGLSPSLVVHDELGATRGPRSALYDALETATGAAAAPLSIIISTQAPTDADLFSVLIDDAAAGHDPRVVLRWNKADDKVDPFSVEAIRQANPAFDCFMNRDEVLAMARDAKRMRARENEYFNLVLNQRVERHSPFIGQTAWQSCGECPEPIDGVPVFGGLDLSAVSDLTSLTLIGNVGGVWQVDQTFWLPDEGLAEKSRTDRVAYDTYKSQGFLETTPGRAVDYAYVAAHLRSVFDRYNVQSIAFDPWSFEHLIRWLREAGFTDSELERFVKFPQGYKTMSPALRDLEEAILTKKIAHGNHPLLTRCAANAIVVNDPVGNRRLDKKKSTARIDGLVTLVMALAVASTAQEDPGTALNRAIIERGGLA